MNELVFTRDEGPVAILAKDGQVMFLHLTGFESSFRDHERDSDVGQDQTGTSRIDRCHGDAAHFVTGQDARQGAHPRRWRKSFHIVSHTSARCR